MPLTLGDRLAHYDVTALIGEGAWARSHPSRRRSILQTRSSCSLAQHLQEHQVPHSRLAMEAPSPFRIA